MSEDFSRFFKPGCVHRQLYTDPARTRDYLMRVSMIASLSRAEELG